MSVLKGKLSLKVFWSGLSVFWIRNYQTYSLLKINFYLRTFLFLFTLHHPITFREQNWITTRLKISNYCSEQTHSLSKTLSHSSLPFSFLHQMPVQIAKTIQPTHATHSTQPRGLQKAWCPTFPRSLVRGDKQDMIIKGGATDQNAEREIDHPHWLAPRVLIQAASGPSPPTHCFRTAWSLYHV